MDILQSAMHLLIVRHNPMTSSRSARVHQACVSDDMCFRQDPGQLSAEATITVNVIDTDTMQPAFESPVYSTIVDDPEVSITVSPIYQVL